MKVVVIVEALAISGLAGVVMWLMRAVGELREALKELSRKQARGVHREPVEPPPFFPAELAEPGKGWS